MHQLQENSKLWGWNDKKCDLISYKRKKELKQIWQSIAMCLNLDFVYTGICYISLWYVFEMHKILKIKWKNNVKDGHH